METRQRQWDGERGWLPARSTAATREAQLVLLFGRRELLEDSRRLRELARLNPQAVILGCSTAGEILSSGAAADGLVATEIHFEHTRVALAEVTLDEEPDSERAGRRIARNLAGAELAHVLVLSDGLEINGSALVQGMISELPPGVQITGGLAADGEAFETTLTCTQRGARTRAIAAVGFYGSRLKVGFGSRGGWDPFGPERIVTRSQGNVLHELDGRNALELYRLYLGEYAERLPASALLFPLSVRPPEGGKGVVRTVLSVDEQAGTMTFAGDLPKGHYARLMKANFERLIDGATDAAAASRERLDKGEPAVAILISCVGRRMVLDQRTEEELETVRRVLGDATVLTGFYSYGEIAPSAPASSTELHNQTMTITLLTEGSESPEA